MSQAYDYIIVGAGTAGSTLAARLSEEADVSVLLLEAGVRNGGFWTRLPVGYFRSIYDARVSHLFKGAPDPGIAGRQMDVPRGRVVGGSSAINGLIYIRGQQEDFDDWADQGAEGWSYRDVLPYFRSIERYDGPPSQYRGAHGAVHVSDLRNENAACDAWLDAARQSGLPDNPDFNGESTYGLGRYQLTLRGRWRESAATAWLEPALDRPNLTLQTEARTVGLTFDGDRVTGLRYVQRGQEVAVHAAREVILAAGSVQSPQLLQLAGIGPPDLLRGHGINVRVAAPGVGQNLQDHLQMRTIVELRNGRDSLNRQVRNPVDLARMGLDWALRGRGPLTVGAGQVGGAACTDLAEGGRPDVQLFVMPLSVDKPGKPLQPRPGFTTSFWQCHPTSRGHINRPTAGAEGLVLSAAGLADEANRALRVPGVREELAQAVANLIENAVKYGRPAESESRMATAVSPAAEPIAPPMSEIRVMMLNGTGRRRGMVGIAVEDDGPGIAREHLPRLTERFYRVSVSRSRERGGTGLGLAIVKHVVNRHRGTLEIDSTIGVGSRFAIWLPLD